MFKKTSLTITATAIALAMTMGTAQAAADGDRVLGAAREARGHGCVRRGRARLAHSASLPALPGAAAAVRAWQ